MEKIATREAYGNTLVKIGDNKDIVVLDADLSCATKSNAFEKKYPERFFNIGIAEQDMVGTAAGLQLLEKSHLQAHLQFSQLEEHMTRLE